MLTSGIERERAQVEPTRPALSAAFRTPSLAALGRWARPRLARTPWASGLGLARTLLALGTLGTLLATPTPVLLSPLADGTRPPLCGGPAKIGLWCVASAGHGELARWLCAAVLLVVASGWRPRFTGIPHWYVAWSFMVNTTIVDGGDQITAVLALLLIPVTLTDPRRWHWYRLPDRPVGAGRVLAYTALLLIQLQVAGLYLHASVGKLGVREWADGTAMFYWLRNPVFGAVGPPRAIVDLITGSAVGVAVFTWSAIALEFALALAILLSPSVKRRLLVLGLVFHGLIAITMGLISFSTAMWGALLLYLLPIGHQVRLPRAVPGWLARLAPATAARLAPASPASTAPGAGVPELVGPGLGAAQNSQPVIVPFGRAAAAFVAWRARTATRPPSQTNAAP